MEQFATVVGVKPRPEADGSHFIKVRHQDAEIDVLLSQDVVRDLLENLQRGQIDMAAALAVLPNFPIFQMTDIQLGHGSAATALLVTTAEIGTFGLMGSPDILRSAKSEITRALRAADRGKPH